MAGYSNHDDFFALYGNPLFLQIVAEEVWYTKTNSKNPPDDDADDEPYDHENVDGAESTDEYTPQFPGAALMDSTIELNLEIGDSTDLPGIL